MALYGRWTALAVLTACLLVVSGCGRSGPEVVAVTGTLAYKGKPVPNAELNFAPEKGRQTWAITDAEGKFKVNYDRDQDGAVAGKNKVWIVYKPSEANVEGTPAPPKELRPFFDKYSYQNTKLEVTIDRSKRELKLDLD